MRILVTGGAGFIGCNFVRSLLEHRPGDEVVVLDKLTYAGRKENLQDVLDRISFVKGDITDPRDVGRAGQCDAIINFAAETHVDRSIADPGVFVRTDVLGTHVLLEHARREEVDTYIQVSTDEVYGSRETGSFRETDPLDPSSPYSASKAGADHLALAYFRTYGLPVCITRSSNNFGPYQYPEKLIPVLILRALRGEPIPIYGTGEQVRDWLHVGDNCAALRLVLGEGRPGQVYNIASGEERRNIEVARLILSLLGRSESLITHVADRPGHDFRYSIDTTKIRDLGWRPARSFEKGLGETVNWYRENEGWWKPLIGGDITGGR
ncbi:MAG: dTDP-glucose 4,6-dehydratase [Methanomicrobiales archaeon]|nr:dTDP-glucose 4,6-dehydratase [Methanomicrobiales archaeon]